MQNPYSAPGAQSARAEDDIAAAVPPLIARVAGGAVALAGVIVALSGLQTMLIGTLRAPYTYVPYGLIALGAPALYFGATIFRARAWGALAGMCWCGLLTLASIAWLVVSVSHMFFSLYALGSPACTLAGLVLAIVAMGPCQRASEARARLVAQGMNLGI